jgi:hypothetical protein
MDVAVSDVHLVFSEIPNPADLASEGALSPPSFQSITMVLYLEQKRPFGSEANEF